MRVFRRYASLIATLVFLTSGPLAAWHVARETVPRSPCDTAALVASVTDAHGAVPGPGACLACHLLQQTRIIVSVTSVPAATAHTVRRVTLEQTPHVMTFAEHVPARAPPPPALG